MSTSRKQPVKGSIQYIRFGLTVSRFSKFLKRIGTKEVGIAGDSGQCPIARFVVDALGASEAEIAGEGNGAAPAVSTPGYDAGTTVGLPKRKWASRFVYIVDDIFSDQPVTGSQALRALRLARDARTDPHELQDWENEYVQAGKGPVALARRRRART